MKIFVLIALFFPLITIAAEKGKTRLWQEWYLFTVGGISQGYFMEEAEKRTTEKHLAISQNWFEIENGGTETFIGSVSKDDNDLTPVAFFSERKNPKKSYKVDARVSAGNVEITFKPISPAGINIKDTRNISKGTILSNFLPMKIAKSKTGPISFQAIVEDPKDSKYESRIGKGVVKNDRKKIKTLNCRKAEMQIDGIPSEWWINDDGRICEINFPTAQAKLSLSTEAEVKSALKK